MRQHATLIIAAVIVVGTWNLSQRSLHLLFDGVPEDIDLGAIRQPLPGLPGVIGMNGCAGQSTAKTGSTGSFRRTPKDERPPLTGG